MLRHLFKGTKGCDKAGNDNWLAGGIPHLEHTKRHSAATLPKGLPSLLRGFYEFIQDTSHSCMKYI